MLFAKEKLASYPTLPGVYIMKDENSRVLYVGKAKNLRQRLKQYFLKTDERATVPFLVAKIASIETIVVTNEKEALLLENNLIKKEKPQYNLLLKDDKTFVSLMITKHKWPEIKLVRTKKYNPKNEYFGPYTNARAAKLTLDLIFQLFQLRQCSNSEFFSRTRPCILYDIKRCLAPCVGKCSQKEYENQLQMAKALLKGQNKQLLKKLKEQMHNFSQKMEYEKAEEKKQLIAQIRHISEIQYVENLSFKNSDAIGYFANGEKIILTVLSYREGRLIASRHFSFSFFLKNLKELIETFLMQYYKNEKAPQTILLPLPLKNKLALEEILNSENFAKAKHKTKLCFPKKGAKLQAQKAAQNNAKSLFEREEKLDSLNEKWLLSLQEELKLSHFPKNILCFDASHLAEEHKVAVLVFFTNGKKEGQKLFKIKTLEKGDIHALEEVLFRHFSKVQVLPDLLIIDGGKAHLNAALKTLAELKIATIDCLGLAKEQARHDKGLRKEAVYLAHQKEAAFLGTTSPSLFMLQKIRDEAHRSAISFYRRLAGKQIQKSLLDDIPGIGQIKKKMLLKHFKSVEKIKQASLEELAQVKSLKPKDIQTIFAYLRKTES